MVSPTTKLNHPAVRNRAYLDAQENESGVGTHQLTVRQLGTVAYESTWMSMKQWTLSRSAGEPDQIWLLQHSPVYTLGVAARDAHLPKSQSYIPVIKTDRGGQITYHGPGQIVIYTLLDLRRRGLGVRSLVRILERSVIDLLEHYGANAHARRDAPGVYVEAAKIAALGLRIRNGCSYHGLSVNVDMDLSPFENIDPCGYPGLRVTQFRNLGIKEDINTIAGQLLDSLKLNLQEKLNER